MGREVASALGRWCALLDHPAEPELVAICDTSETARDWFSRVSSVKLFTADYRELLGSKGVDVVYVAVPHHLHLEIYGAVLAAGKDLFAEKPFGIDLAAALALQEAVKNAKSFVRCSSEFPFLPGPQRAFAYANRYDPSLGSKW